MRRGKRFFRLYAWNWIEDGLAPPGCPLRSLRFCRPTKTFTLRASTLRITRSPFVVRLPKSVESKRHLLNWRSGCVWPEIDDKASFANGIPFGSAALN